MGDARTPVALRPEPGSVSVSYSSLHDLTPSPLARTAGTPGRKGRRGRDRPGGPGSRSWRPRRSGASCSCRWPGACRRRGRTSGLGSWDSWPRDRRPSAGLPRGLAFARQELRAAQQEHPAASEDHEAAECRRQPTRHRRGRHPREAVRDAGGATRHAGGRPRRRGQDGPQDQCAHAGNQDAQSPYLRSILSCNSGGLLGRPIIQALHPGE